MDSIKTSEDDEESKVIEYYRKYSQNPDLVKYFAGLNVPTATKKPTLEDVEVDEKSTLKPQLKVNTSETIVETNPMHDVADNKSLSASPSSSVESNKKLEWDNGADIGYKNSYKLSAKKSASFPSLLSDNFTEKNTKHSEEKSIVENKEDLRNMYHQLTFSSETSVTPNKDNRVSSSSSLPKDLITSSSHSDQVVDKYCSSSSGSIPYLQKRIGKPVAYSTPTEQLISTRAGSDCDNNTPKIETQHKQKKSSNIEIKIDEIINSEKNGEILNHDKFDIDSGQVLEDKNQLILDNRKISPSFGAIKREINLCTTKPIFIECLPINGIECANKLSQTSFSSEKPSKSVQTDDKNIILGNYNEKCTPLTRKVEYIYHLDDKCSDGLTSSIPKMKETYENDKLENSRLITTEFNEKDDHSIIGNSEKHGFESASKQSSFKTKPPDNASNNDTSYSSCSRDYEQKSTNSRKNEEIVNETKKKQELPSSEIFSLNHAHDLNTDIKRSIDILQKLLKSKKYDHATKKRYIKKIVQKIVESKYSDDSTTSSELFHPRRKNIATDCCKKKETIPTTKRLQTDANLMDNVPWYPATQCGFSKKSSKEFDCKSTKSTRVNTKNDDIQPENVTRDDHDIIDLVKKLRGFNSKAPRQSNSADVINVNEKHISSYHSQESTDEVGHQKYREKKSVPINFDNKVYSNWKTDKTLSERLLESRDKVKSKMGQGDYLLQVATNERKHQLSWINNEIEYLSKLKDMLEDGKSASKSHLRDAVSALLKMKVGDMEELLPTKPSSAPPRESQQRESGVVAPLSPCEKQPPGRALSPSRKRTTMEKETLRRIDRRNISVIKCDRTRAPSESSFSDEVKKEERVRREPCTHCLGVQTDISPSIPPVRATCVEEKRHRVPCVDEKRHSESGFSDNEKEVYSISPITAGRHSRSRSSDSALSGKEMISKERGIFKHPTSSTSPKRDKPHVGICNQPKVQLYTCTTDNSAKSSEVVPLLTQQKECSCNLQNSCKCNETATHEEKDAQFCAYKQSTCQTGSNEDVSTGASPTMSKGEHGCQCNKESMCQHKKKESLCQKKKKELTSSITSDSGSSSQSNLPCICCKKKKILRKLSSTLSLCDPCHKFHEKSFYPHNYTHPQHSCLCYSLVDRGILCQLKDTVTELERLDIYQQYCDLLKNCKCCDKCGCKCKLPKKFKNGFAYFLKLEDACPKRHCEDHYDEFDGEDPEERRKRNYLPEVTVRVPNYRCHCSQNENKNGNRNGTKKYMSCSSIQTYLYTMRPEFIEKAESRRKILRNAVLEREEDVDARKLRYMDKINFLNRKNWNQKVFSDTSLYEQDGGRSKAFCVFDVELNDAPKRIQPRVFRSFKEMKDLTRRRYLHLNEVKKKKQCFKEKRLREANRILADTFTRRLQRSTLKGNVDIPTNVRVVTY